MSFKQDSVYNTKKYTNIYLSVTESIYFDLQIMNNTIMFYLSKNNQYYKLFVCDCSYLFVNAIKYVV